jgi:hypothetical protein
MLENRRRWWREPLLHFVLLGGIAFFVHRAVRGPLPSKYVLPEDAPLQQIRQDWFSAKGSPPSPEQENALMDDWVEEEILYRRAIELGIDRNDTIVRRRLVQRMRFLLEDTHRIEAPNEAELERWLGEHPEKFASPAKLSFSQWFFSRGTRGAKLGTAARSAFEVLETDPEAAIDADPFFRGRELNEMTQQDIKHAFGSDFAASVADLPLGRWAGPLRSAYGLHLVRVSERLEPPAPGIEEVRDEVIRDWMEAERARRNEESIQALRARYSPPGER